MSGIADFLTARYAEWEALALAAARVYGKDWRADTSHPMRSFIIDEKHGEPVVLDVEGAEPAEFIAANDPRLILRQVAAGRARLAEHGSLQARQKAEDPVTFAAVLRDFGPIPDRCLTCTTVRPCRTLRIDAEVFSDHPDFKETWKP